MRTANYDLYLKEIVVHDASPRFEEFERNAPVWLVVRHFLPAPLVGELFAAIVQRWGRGEIALADVAKIELSDGSETIANLAYIPKPRQSAAIGRPTGELTVLAEKLRRIFQCVVWQGDQSDYSNDPDKEDPFGLGLLNDALELSSRDLATLPDNNARLEDNELSPVIRAMQILSEAVSIDGSGGINDVREAIGDFKDGPLLPVLLKHFGDLSGDCDRWDIAEPFYREAAQSLNNLDAQDWSQFRTSLSAIISQSQAAAIRITHGPRQSAVLLDELFERKDNDTLTMLNASFDRMGAHLVSGNWTMDFTRGASLLAPQLISAHHAGNALGHLLEGKHRDAHRWFWASLRRQIALGSAMVSRDTKASFGRSIIEQLGSAIGKNHSPGDFFLGVRLLIESGNSNAVKAMSWDKDVFATYVDLALLEKVFTLVNRHPGARVERHRVLTGLLPNWLAMLPSDDAEISSRCMTILSETFASFRFNGHAERNVGEDALKALIEVGKARPEFAAKNSSNIVEALLLVFDDAHGRLAADILDALLRYARHQAATDRQETAARVLDRLDHLESDEWFRRHALNFLSDPKILELAKDREDDFAKRLVRSLVTLALSIETEQRQVMYLLQDLDPELFEDAVDDVRLQRIIEQLSTGAGEVNSSTASSCVHALLAAPAIAGEAGVVAAMDGLAKILDSMISKRIGFAAADAFQPLILLSERQWEIAESAGIERVKMEALLQGLEDRLYLLWESALERPAIFNGIALPAPTEPNRILVHNWTFASLEFAQSIGQLRELEKVLERAAQNAALGPYIATAKAVRIGRGGVEAFDDLPAIAVEGRDAFYAALGNRLLALDTLGEEEQKTALSALIDRCLIVGPSGLDSSIFLAAIDRDLKLRDNVETIGYVERMRADRDLRHGLMPLIARIVASDESP